MISSLRLLFEQVEYVAAFVGREGLLLISALALFVVLGGGGRSLGLPSLFWRTTIDSLPRGGRKRFLVRSTRFFIGMSVGVLLGANSLVGMLVESRDREWTAEFFLHGFYFLCLGSFLIIVVIWLWRPFERKSDPGILERSRMETCLLPVGSAVGLVGFGVLATSLAFQRVPFVTTLVEQNLPEVETTKLAAFHVEAGLLVILGSALYVVLLILNRIYEREVPPAIVICLLLTVVSALHGFVAYRWPSAQIPMYLVGLCAYVFLNAHWKRARVPTLESVGSSREGCSLLGDEDALDAWRSRHDAPPILVVVAADGGGVRSALWTTTVLTCLEQGWPTFARHVRLVTGASGGMLGASVWTSTLMETSGAELPWHASGGERLTRCDLLTIAEKGALSAVASGLVFRDILPSPFRFGPDRGRELERVWESNCAELAKPLSVLATGEKEGWRPSLTLAPMIVEDGRRLLIGNLDLRALLQNKGPLGGDQRDYSLGGVQLFDQFPAAQSKLPLSTAVRLQANFPWILPSTELPPFDPGAPRLRVVDAGYYDESGVDLACLWIFQHRNWLKANTNGVLLVQNRDRSYTIYRHRLPFQHRSCFKRGLDGISTPISGLLRAWGSATWFRNDAAVAALARVINQGNDKFFTTAVFELDKEAALTWSITPEEARDIRANVNRTSNAEMFANLDEWRKERSNG